MNKEARPLVVQLVFHPESKDASDLALWLHNRLNQDPAVPGLRIPTVFLDEDGTGLPPTSLELPREGARVAVIALADDYLTAYSGKRRPNGMSWGDLLVGLRNRCYADGQRFIPIQLTDNAWPIDPRLLDTNFLRAWTFDGNERNAFVSRRVVHDLCKLLAPEERSDLEIPVTLFISHTKIDLNEEPQAVRALLALLNAAQPEKTWFDSGDIDTGSRFAAKIEEGVADSALIAVLTDSYASREWCRREVLLAKEQGRPVVVVDALRLGEVRSFPYLGNVPVIRWHDNAQEVVDLLLRENLRHLYARRCLQLQGGVRDTLLPSAPELVTVIKKQGARILYPDPPLGDEEASIIAAAGIEIETPLQRFTRKVKEQHRGKLVALSVSEAEDIAEFGLRKAHLDAAHLELCRYLLLAEMRLAYGGHLESGGYTLGLFNLLKDPIVERLRRGESSSNAQVISHIGWPLALTVGERARYGQLVEIRRVPRPSGIDEQLDPALVTDPELRVPCDSAVRRFAWCLGMSQMRLMQTEQTAARVVVGGKTGVKPGKTSQWYSSRIPGVLEEVLLSVRAGKPVYLIGAFGGAARMIFDVIEGKDRIEMTWDYQKRAPFAEDVRRMYEERGLTWEDYPAIVEFLRGQGLAGVAFHPQ